MIKAVNLRVCTSLKCKITLFMIVCFFSALCPNSYARPLVDRVLSKNRLVRHRLGFINFSPFHLGYGIEVEKIIMVQSSISYYKMLDESEQSFQLRASWPGLSFNSQLNEDGLYRQVYGIGLGASYSEKVVAPQRKQAYLQELFIPIVIDFDLSYIYKKSGFNLFGGLGVNIKALDEKQRQESDNIVISERYSPFFELGLGYSF